MNNYLIKKFNLLGYLDSHSIEYKIVYSSEKQEINLKECPFCKNINYKGNIHKYRIYIDDETKLFYCFNCGKKGGLVRLLQVYEQKTNKEIIEKFLYNKSILSKKLERLIEEKTPPFSSTAREPEIKLAPLFFDNLIPFNPKYKEAYEYINRRGFLDINILRQMDIKYSDKMKRIIFPIYSNNNLVGWQGRDITNQQEPKYLISKGFKKHNYLYNYDNVKQCESIILLEGLIDFVKCIKYNPVVSFGKNLSNEQFKLLLNINSLKNVYIGYDNDAYVEKMKYAKLLSQFFNVFIIEWPTNKDAGDLDSHQIDECIKNAPIFSDKIISVLR